MFRVGLGRDLHRLSESRALILGGELIPSQKGAEGHSDADVLVHAIIDALLGAAALGDIGEFFPDTDPSFKDVSSMILLEKVLRKMREKFPDFKILNIDCVISLERPAVSPYKKNIRRNLAAVLGISPEQVHVKGKTGEGIGDVGEGRAIEALAVAALDI
ncbi:MAG: 2-C-methyl-D-erythritol 2,4-cyclodiphosphate synthase [Spirochaetaceae bacterium]|jgi:2-C-methyl-D-erythritol 2,4-cyclodiphosphate synthase|nr:2-C-methyl-D-erythritol 2,4-cyclodiphosphate synthase [Spirochaetaceae bacterium]